MSRTWVWLDLENTPHVLFLEPILRHIQSLGFGVKVTARPQSQTLELAADRGIEVVSVGWGDGIGPAAKLVFAAHRAFALAAWALRQGRPRLLVSSSRTASAAALILRIPAVALLDYEHARHRSLALASEVLWMPDVLREVQLPAETVAVVQYYEGLKENLYLDSWRLDRATMRSSMGLSNAAYVVVGRPPASGAHYARGDSWELWKTVMLGLLDRPEVYAIVSPRTHEQGRMVSHALGANPKLTILTRAVVGPPLVDAADLVIGGGGTMNREAAVLGVPVWSVFTGPPPCIDGQLAVEGKLRWLRTVAEAQTVPRGELPGRHAGRGPFPGGLRRILDDITTRLGRHQ